MDQIQDSLMKLAAVKGNELRLRHDTVQNLIVGGSNITTAREQAAANVASYTVELIRIQADIDSLQLALAHCDRALQYETVLD